MTVICNLRKKAFNNASKKAIIRFPFCYQSYIDWNKKYSQLFPMRIVA